MKWLRRFARPGTTADRRNETVAALTHSELENRLDALLAYRFKLESIAAISKLKAEVIAASEDGLALIDEQRSVIQTHRLDAADMARLKELGSGEFYSSVCREMDAAEGELVEALARNRFASVRHLVEISLDGASEGIRSKARMIGHKLSADGFLTAARDDNPRIRKEAFLFLSHLTGPSVVEALLTALRDPEVEIRRNAAQWLSSDKHKHRKALGPLKEAKMNDSDDLVRWAAGAALSRLYETKR